MGAYDERTGRGGPVYATQIVDDADAMIEFFTRVLDMEVRSDRTWAEYAVPFRFTLIHAKGLQTGHTPLVEYTDEHEIPGLAAPRPPNRGMAMWSYKVKTLMPLSPAPKPRVYLSTQDQRCTPHPASANTAPRPSWHPTDS